MNKKESFILTFLGLFWILFPLIILFYKDLKIFIIFFCITFILQCIYLIRYSSNVFKQMYIKGIYIIYEQPINAFYENIFKNIPGVGDFLMFLCKFFSKWYTFLGYYAIIFTSIIFFILPHVIFISLVFLRIFFMYKISTFAFIFLILFIRIIKVIFVVLCDFCLHNKDILDGYLKVTAMGNRTYSYDFKDNNIVDKTQETLNLYVSRHILFEETHSYMQSTINYKNKIIKPWLNPLMLSILFTSNLKIISMLFAQYFNLYVFVIIFVSTLTLEKYNIYKEKYHK